MGGSESRYEAFLAKLDQETLRRGLIEVSGKDSRTLEIRGARYINLASNDYLGLRFNKVLISRACNWAMAFGAGAGASRLVTGNLELFTHIEEKTAALKKKPAALVLATGFQASAGVIRALLDRTVIGSEPLVFADRLNHASMHFGCQAAGATQIRYRHVNIDHLRALLERHRDSDRPKFILTETVFSMDGDVAPMPEIAALAREHDAMLVVDDAHATGVLGEGGGGLSEGADVVIGTFSKALGSFGAYVACSETMRDYLINRCGALIYSTALPPQVLGAIDAALDLLPNMDEDRLHVASLAERFRQGATELGFNTGSSSTQIVPIIAGSADAALRMSNRLKGYGFWTTAIRPPTVPKGTSRVRCVFTAAHTGDDVDWLLEALRAFKRLAQPAATA